MHSKETVQGNCTDQPQDRASLNWAGSSHHLIRVAFLNSNSPSHYTFSTQTVTNTDTCCTLVWSLLAFLRPAYHHHESCHFSPTARETSHHYVTTQVKPQASFRFLQVIISVSQNTAILALKCTFTQCCHFSQLIKNQNRVEVITL